MEGPHLERGEAMTFRVLFGIDPGQSGAIAVLADGRPWAVIDMPRKARTSGAAGFEVDGIALGRFFRRVRQDHPGAVFLAALELVGAMTTKDKDGNPKGQAALSMFRFGQSDGIVRGVMQALGVAYVEVSPLSWKRRHGLIIDQAVKGETKSQRSTRAKAISLEKARVLFPTMRGELVLVKHSGRAEALLIARWAHDTAQTST